MFDIGWSELLVIAVVALIVIGPKELPAVLRTVGQWTAKSAAWLASFKASSRRRCARLKWLTSRSTLTILTKPRNR